MSLVRKISLAKWKQNDIGNGEDVSADAITSCLRTTANTLSVWQIENLESLELAVLAIVSNQERLDTIDVVILPEEKVLECEIEIDQTPGNTPIEQLINTHRDLSNLTYFSLGYVSEIIADEIVKERTTRYTVGSIKKLLKRFILEGVLDIDQLKDGVKNKL